MYLFKFLILFFLSTLLLHSAELKHVSLQLQWKYQYQFAGYIVAQEKGFYKAKGLDVTIKEWSAGINMVDELIQNRSEYIIARPSSLIDVSQGKKLVYLAAVFQSSPLVILADESSGIRSVEDFKHKRLMTTGDLNSDTSLLSMLYSHGVQLQDFNLQSPSFNPADLLSGKTDLMVSYISNEPFILKSLGGKPVIFNPRDYGFNFYNDFVTTSKEHLEKEPLEVKAFRDATLQGWEYAFSHIDEVVNLLYKKYNSQKKSKEALKYEAEELKKLAYYHTNVLGKIDKSKLYKIYDVYKLLGLVHGEELNFNEILYSEQFLATQLTNEEQQYLQKNSPITMCIDPNWMPFEHFDEDGHYEGMTAEYYKLFAKILGTKFQVIPTKSWSESIEFAKARKCDIYSLAMETPARKEYMNFTSPYLKIPLVVATKLDVPFIDNITELKGKKLGIPKGYAFIEILKDKYPFLNIVEVKDIDEGLEKLSRGELFGYIGTLTSIGYKFQTKYSAELKVTGKIDEKWELGIGVNNEKPILLSILQKAINNVTKDQQRDIFNHWISIKYEQGINYALVWEIIAVFTLIFAIGLYVMSQQQKLKKSLQEANEKLELAYKELKEVAIRDKLTKLYNRHKLDEVLFQEKHRADRYGSNFGIMILDIDHFKRVNDNYGHHVGDLILEEFANILQENSRETDIIGRWGGEEFLVIAPEINEKSINFFANNIKRKIEKHLFVEKYRVTASIGITIYKQDEEIDTMITRADEALYFSKKSGRNMVTAK